MSKIIPEDVLANKVEKLQEDLNEINKLFELVRISNCVVDINALTDKVAEFLKIQFRMNDIAIFTLQDNKYRVISHDGINNPYSFEFSNSGEGIWQVIKQGEPFYVIDENGKNIYSQFFASNNLSMLESVVWLPFIDNNEVLAIAALGVKKKNEKYTESDFRFLSKINDYIAPTIKKYIIKQQNEKSIGELQKTLHNISILYNVGQAMNFIDDLKNLLRVILGKAIQAIGAQKGSLMLYDKSNDELVIKVVYGLPDKEIEDKINDGLIECTKIKAGEGIAGSVLNSKKSIITNLGEDDPRFKKSSVSRVASILCVPLIVKGEAIGVINITNKLDGKFFNQDDLNFMGALSNQAAIAINNAQLYELAITDGLTKLYIYRHFQYLMENELKRAYRYKHPITLLMMDIDNFKSINDNYGHLIGDEILRQISHVIMTTIRKIDMPSRYGGEEFAVILPETSKENALNIAERLRQKIQAIIVVKDGHNVSPTISIGISTFPENASNQDEFIETADKALYYAKKSGKNCVAEYAPDECRVLSCSISPVPTTEI